MSASISPRIVNAVEDFGECVAGLMAGLPELENRRHVSLLPAQNQGPAAHHDQHYILVDFRDRP